MGLPLLIIGLLMVITGERGTYAQFGAQIATDFQSTGTYGSPGYSPGFGIWLLALGSIGALGYIPEIRTISRYLMALVILVLFLHNKGFFGQFQSALTIGPKQPTPINSTSPMQNATTPGVASAPASVGAQFPAGPQATPSGAQSFGNFFGNLFAPSPAY